jgi:integrase
MATGITKRHSRTCRSREGGRCNCNAGWEASVYSKRDGRKIRKTFAREAEARSWRADALSALSTGTLRAPTKTTLREAAAAWLRGAESGEIRSKSGHPYKPSTLRGYRQALEERVLPELGAAKLSAVTTTDLQALVDRWQAERTPASTIRNAIKPLQAIYRRAKSRGGLPVNPTRDLELPAPRPREVEIVGREVAARLLEAVPPKDRLVWTTALYAGLRYGELRALRWASVDVAGGTIAVSESWDPKEGPIDPKTRTSRRTVPMPGVLRDLFVEQRLVGDHADDDLVFGPFHATALYRRADEAWAAAGLKQRLRLHQARHTYASFMIAAGVNAKALCSYMGHSSIKVTFDLYGHLMPGAEAEAASLLDAFLAADRDHAADMVRAGVTGAPTGAP